jgi:cyanophycinase
MNGGTIVLAGGAEFGGQMAQVDRLALQAAGGLEAHVCIVPTAAAPDNNHARAGGNGERWFRGLGATNVSVVPVIDVKSAHDPKIMEILAMGRLFYLLGGFPRYLGETLLASAAWQAMLEAYTQGAVIAGSSAGAMVLCESYYDPHSREILPGLGLILKTCFLPHHNTFGRGWAADLRQRLPGYTLLGLDEQTGALRLVGEEQWLVAGRGAATVYRGDDPVVYPASQTFQL